MLLFERDPEAIGPETDEEASERLDLYQSIHEFEPDENGRCQGFLIRGYKQIRCNSTQESSVFHETDDEFVEGGAHWHGGGDCMCFEY